MLYTINILVLINYAYTLYFIDVIDIFCIDNVGIIVIHVSLYSFGTLCSRGQIRLQSPSQKNSVPEHSYMQLFQGHCSFWMVTLTVSTPGNRVLSKYTGCITWGASEISIKIHIDLLWNYAFSQTTKVVKTLQGSRSNILQILLKKYILFTLSIHFIWLYIKFLLAAKF